MLNTFSGKEGTILCCSENEEVNQFTIDYQNIEFEVRGSKLRMFWKEIMDSWMEATVVKVGSCLNRATPSSCWGRLRYYVNIVSWSSPLMEDLRYRNIAFEFWAARSFVRLMRAEVTEASVMVWYLVKMSLPPISRIP